ncbi:hypothetical protein CAOG_01100 [Capsaspora owczarzaki ATCC 30864]|uniref:Uncharacterized protein n=1 Tax=Capsaspora owczarzaki (strain ATCC 30864) TaxID=595528 RepID=A0A0D2WIJ9_CAPO3|nr:hypothetical protein CAOG_01100 [Capsaspora owczarzaki ATCC 30864]KJE89665.1 hypothetical protein CAOG_001100 [Capsaspora owczarzaki ATCC 30864]|eukprot:XP_004365971.1 hypothetical protein CAOG_01100 [Capsaspora owczarzaki ATCC 30864]
MLLDTFENTPFLIDIAFGLTLVTFQYRAIPKGVSLPQRFLSTMIVVLAGPTICSALLGGVPDWLLRQNPSLWFFPLVFALVHFTRGVVPAIVEWPPIWFALSVIGNVGQASAATTWGCDRVTRHPNSDVASSFAAMLLVGLLSSTATILVDSAFNLTKATWSFSLPHDLFHFPWPSPIRSGLFMTVFYAIATDPHHVVTSSPLLPVETAKDVCFAFVVTHYIASELYDRWGRATPSSGDKKSGKTKATKKEQ